MQALARTAPTAPVWRPAREGCCCSGSGAPLVAAAQVLRPKGMPPCHGFRRRAVHSRLQVGEAGGVALKPIYLTRSIVSSFSHCGLISQSALALLVMQQPSRILLFFCRLRGWTVTVPRRGRAVSWLQAWVPAAGLTAPSAP